MADAQFFQKSGSYSLRDVAKFCGAELADDNDAEFVVEDIAAIGEAQGNHLSFLDNKKYREQFQVSQAGACIVHPDLAHLAPAGMRLLLSHAPYTSYARAAQFFYPDTWPQAEISDRAVIEQGVTIGEGAIIEPGSIVKAGAHIGENCWIGAGAVIGKNVVLGAHVRIGENAIISHAKIGNHVRLYPGVCVGQDGFGFAIDPKGFVKVPQLGRVIIEDHVEIGSNTTIDRGAGPDTVIGAGTWIDNLVQIGHNVKIGKCCVIVSQVGISGSTELGDFVMVGGQCGIAGHLKIGDGAKIAAQSGVMRDIAAGQEQMGSPSVPSKQFMRQVAALSKLVKPSKKS